METNLDFSMKTILYTNDFILPIAYFSMTNSHLVVSNSKRIIIYDYRNDFSTKNEAYYMSMYKSKEPNNRLRYLEINCH